MADVRELLERYVEAKDRTLPERMPDIYLPDAVLTYSIETDEISFPSEVRGVQGITDTLVREFGKRFAACKTYYVCEMPPQGTQDIGSLPWLVAMREIAAGALRLGKGYYRWQFARSDGGRLAVQAMHIHIERMAAIPDADGAKLMAIQSGLPYPWLTPAALQCRMDELAAASQALELLRPFCQPSVRLD
jgi:hypothetical protein